MVVVGRSGDREPVSPVVLSGSCYQAQKLLDPLVGPLGETVHLWVECQGYVLLDLQFFTEGFCEM